MASRQEYEYPVPLDEARELLALAEGPLIEKTRHLVEHGGMTWEIDEFHGENAGLVVAELELDREDEPFARPPWLGVEVTQHAPLLQRLPRHAPLSRMERRRTEPVSLRVSLAAQTLALTRGSTLEKTYAVSTSKHGAGETHGSFKTPRGRHVVRAKIGAGAPLNAVFRGRRPTGEIYSAALAARTRTATGS